MLASNTLATINAEGTPRATAATAAAAATARESEAEKARLGQDQFLTLMLAQLKNQDPLKPLEPAEFLGQLAQFSTVTGVQDVNKSVGRLAESMRSTQLIEGASLVGRRVLIESNESRLLAGEPIRGAFEVPEGARTIEVAIRDAAGAQVRRVQMPAAPGLTEFQWDGLTDRGTSAAPGSYRIEALARIGDRAESLPTLLQRRVDSVTIERDGSGITLNTASGAVPIGSVRRVL